MSPRVTYNVAPIPGVLTAPSVIIQSRSSGFGRLIVRLLDRACCASLNAALRSLDEVMTSFDCCPATPSSGGARNVEQLGITLPRTLYAPINDLMRPTVSGAGQEAGVSMRCGLGCRVPDIQIYPRMVVDVGLTTLLDADRRKKAWRTFFQFLAAHRGCFLHNRGRPQF